MGDMAREEVQWLSEAEQVSWRAYLRANRELDVALDRDLQAAGISLSEYELLSMLSEAAMGQLRMSALASLIGSLRLLRESSRGGARVAPAAGTGT